MIKLLFFAIINSMCNTFANAIWKYRFNKYPLNTSSFYEIIRTCFNLPIISGVIFYAISMMTFFYLLSNYKMSNVIPLLALNYVFNFIVAYFFFKENINIMQILGLSIIIVGLFIYSKGI